MRKNKWKIISICVIVYSVLISGVLVFGFKYFQKSEIQRTISKVADVPLDGEMITGYKSNSGFFGDGTTYIQINLSNDLREDIKEAIKANGSWEELPCTDILAEPVYDSYFFENVEHDYEGLFPEIENGWYYFLDKQTGDLCSQVKSDIWNRSSSNYIYAVYDIDKGILYYYETDT